MKRFITIISVAVAVALSATAATQRTPVADIEPYVGSMRTPARAASLTVMPDGKTYATIAPDHRSIRLSDIATGKETGVLLDLATTRENKIDRIDRFAISDNGAYVMVGTDIRPVYRRSTTGTYYTYEVRSRILRPLSTEHPRQQAPLFSPDGLMVAFMAADNNIYLRKLTYNTEVAVTTDGAVNSIINGVPDWTYEEEFTTASSMAWAPDSRTLCYLKYNESNVRPYSLTLYEGSCEPKKEYALYPGTYTYKYPVAGMDNSTVTLHSYDIDNRKTKDIAMPDTRIEYIPRIAFGGNDPDRLMVVTLNRNQNRMEIYSVNPRSAVARSVLVEESKAWILPESYEAITWQPDGFVVMSGRTGHTHFYRYSYSGALLGAITSGNYDATAYYGYNAATGCHYVQTTATGAINRVVSRIDRQGRTTHLSPESGTASAEFTPGMDYYTLTYSNSTTPPSAELRAVASGKKLRTMADNSGEYASRYASMPKPEFITVATDGGLQLNAFVIKPAGFDPSRKYPVVMYQYSGPGSQQVRDAWTVDWYNYFAMKGYVILCVDGRGTGYRGTDFMYAVYKDLGHYETIDQLAGARYAASLPWVDASRIGMHGWSYGGYETLMCVTDPASPFAAGVAVAPVSDWRYYDTVYAERYMLTPGENEAGYEASAPLGRVDNLNCPLLVMTGTADDNVHPENSIEFAARLEGANNYCDMLLFPNMNHSINGCGARALLYARMLDYFNASMR